VTDAQPGLAPGEPDPDAEPAFELAVDGEVFEIVYSSSRGSHFAAPERIARLEEVSRPKHVLRTRTAGHHVLRWNVVLPLAW
jgi:hypothetical protein